MTIPTKRIEVADALRGFALLGIVLLHNIDHFDLGNTVATQSTLLASLDQGVRQALFFLFGGKSYAIFAMLFGFSFYIQQSNCERKGIPFAGRFAWRMVLLFGFGLFHVMFYSGEILSIYAIVGLLLLPLRNLSDRTLIIIAAVCMLEPWEIGRMVYAWCDPDYIPALQNPAYYFQAVHVAKEGTSFWETVNVNLTAGITNAHLYGWYSGRYFQTLALQLIGVLLGRRLLFIQSEESVRFWKRTWIVALMTFIVLWTIKLSQGHLGLGEGQAIPFAVVMDMWSNFAFMAFLSASFVLLWFFTRIRNVESKLAPYGRMSLTNYVCSSIAGSLIYYSYGLGMFDHLGATLSLLVGIAVFTLQLLFSRWWLKNHRYGPLEWVWHKLTWLYLNHSFK